MNRTATSDIAKLKQHVEDVLRLASKLGASQAEATASASDGLSVTVRLRDVETLEYHRDQGLGITVYFGRQKGSASTSDLGAAALEESVRKACALAQYAAEDECAGLADEALLATDPPELDLYHPWAVEPADAIDVATVCETAALDHDARITNSEGASVNTHSGCRVYGNSLGFIEGYRESQHSVSCAVLASDNGQMERDYEYTVARDPAGLSDVGQIGAEAARRAVGRLNPTKLDTTASPVLYPARLARGLFGHMIGAISGGNQYRKSTFLLDSLGQKILADRVTIDELPHIPQALASSPFDNEGVVTTDRRLVDAGVLQGYVLASYYARKLGMQSTGNAGGIHNLVVSNTGETFDELMAAMGTGFLVTELMGQGVNSVTGDYSRGAAGYWVEDGQIKHPVSEVTVAGNLVDMYQNIAAIGTDVDYRGGIRTGSVLVEGMTIAGN